jgi:hypothetical protein
MSFQNAIKPDELESDQPMRPSERHLLLVS